MCLVVNFKFCEVIPFREILQDFMTNLSMNVVGCNTYCRVFTAWRSQHTVHSLYSLTCNLFTILSISIKPVSVSNGHSECNHLSYNHASEVFEIYLFTCGEAMYVTLTLQVKTTGLIRDFYFYQCQFVQVDCGNCIPAGR